MRLFENKVGRPTNEILRKRKLFNLVLSLTFIFLVSTVMVLFKNINLKGGLFSSKPYVLYSDNVLFNYVQKNQKVKIKLNFRNLNKKTYYYKISAYYGNDKLIKSYDCKKIDLSKKVSLNINMKLDNIYAKTRIYSDSSCENLISTSKTKVYKINKTIKTTTQKIGNYKTTTSSLNISFNENNMNMGSEKQLLILSGKVSSVTSSNTDVVRVIKESDTKYKVRAVGAGGSAKIYVKSSTGEVKTYNQNVNFTKLTQSRLKKGLAYSKVIGKTTIYVEKGCENSNTNKMITDFSESPNYMKRAAETVFIMKKSTLQSLDNTSYGITLTKYLNADLSCDTYYPWMMSHELAHIADGKYLYYTGQFLSYNNNWTNLYNSNLKNKKYLRSYSYSNRLEFFADSYSYYFHKNIAKTNTIKNTKWSSYSSSDSINNEVKKALNTFSNMGW